MTARESNSSEFHHTREESRSLSANPLASLYDDTYDRAEVFPNGGRPWVEAYGGQQKDPSP